MSQENNDLDEKKKIFAQQEIKSRQIDLPNCTNEKCEHFGTTDRINFAFAGGGNTYRCYGRDCHTIVESLL